MAENLPQQRKTSQGDIAYWMGKVDAHLSELRTSVDRQAGADEGNWKAFREWQKSVDLSLAKIPEIECRLETLEEQKRDAQKEQQANDKENNPWRYAIEKFGLPVMLAFVTWFLLTVLPAIVAGKPVLP